MMMLLIFHYYGIFVQTYFKWIIKLYETPIIFLRIIKIKIRHYYLPINVFITYNILKYTDRFYICIYSSCITLVSYPFDILRIHPFVLFKYKSSMGLWLPLLNLEIQFSRFRTLILCSLYKK